MKGLLIVGGLFVLLLFSFGCLGTKGKPAGVEPPSAGLPSGLGDADISPQVNPDDAPVVSQEDVVPQDNTADNSAVTIPADARSSLTFGATDIDVVQISDPDVISDQDVIGPE